MSSDGKVARAVDGRALAFAEWGDPGGFPVFSLHGTPGSRLFRHYDETVYADAGARVITYDRPGYGGSDRFPGRRVADCVGDVAAIAGSLGLSRFAVVGGSGGGPHALAVAARLPERVTRAAAIASPAPYDAPGLDWFAGMDPLNIEEIGWALRGEDVLVPKLEREAAKTLESVEDDPAKMLGDEWGLSDSDRAELAREERHDVIRNAVREAFRRGIWGWVDDDLCITTPWGFDVGEILVPTQIFYGRTDVLVPPAHCEWLARHVPGSEAVAHETLGHLPSSDLIATVLSGLLRDQR